MFRDHVCAAQASDELVGIICDREMRIYQQIYGTVGEVAKLERTERRYQWLKKRLDERSSQWAVFPDSWRASQLVCMAFCKVTKSQLAEILDQVIENYVLVLLGSVTCSGTMIVDSLVSMCRYSL